MSSGENRSREDRPVMTPRRPVILAFSDYYLPGFRAGGPIRSLSNLVDRLGGEFRFKVVTRNNDLGQATYESVPADVWRRQEKGEVLYLSAARRTFKTIREILRENSHDVVYLGSFTSPLMTIRPLVLRRLGRIPDIPVVVAPRGELAPSALAIRQFKKRLYLSAAKLTSLYRGVLWQASNTTEVEDIQRAMGGALRPEDVLVAPDLPTSLETCSGGTRSRVKTPGHLRVLFLSRVSPMKNLAGALEIIRGVQGTIEFTICGPLEDAAYWGRCRAAIAALDSSIKVVLLEPVPPTRVRALFREHDLFFLPTLGENFGHVIFEAMACGCPALISDRTPWRGLAQQRAGWDLPLDDHESFRKVLWTCVRMNGAEHQVWSKGASEFARTWSRDDGMLEQNRRLFQTALNRGGHPR